MPKHLKIIISLMAIAAGTLMFWIDTRHDLIGIYLVQHQPFDTSLGNRFRELTYEAAAGRALRPAA